MASEQDMLKCKQCGKPTHGKSMRGRTLCIR